MFIILKNYVYECVCVFVCTLFFYMQTSSKGKVGFPEVKQRKYSSATPPSLNTSLLLPSSTATFDFQMNDKESKKEKVGELRHSRSNQDM